MTTSGLEVPPVRTLRVQVARLPNVCEAVDGESSTRAGSKRGALPA